jgi:hypothetical protein
VKEKKEERLEEEKRVTERIEEDRKKETW